MKLFLVSAIVVLVSIESYVPRLQNQNLFQTKLYMENNGGPINPKMSTVKETKYLMQSIASLFLLNSAVIGNANAKTFVDTDVYGDKELKIGNTK